MPSQKKGAPKGNRVIRSEYFVHHSRVTFEIGEGWHCECRQFTVADGCTHTREAAGMRAAQEQIKAKLATGRSQFALGQLNGQMKRLPLRLLWKPGDKPADGSLILPVSLSTALKRVQLRKGNPGDLEQDLKH